MTAQLQKTFCDLSRENLALLARAQRRLLARRRRSRMPLDQRSVANLKLLKASLKEAQQ